MRQLTKNTMWSAIIGAVCFGAACQPPTTNTAVNTTVNAVQNTNSALNANTALNTNALNTNAANANTMGTNGAAIDAREPEQYQATVSLKFETTGAQNLAVPPLKAEVARNGADRRMEFVLPNNQKMIYLEKAGKQLVILPNTKQYAELTKEAVGFEVRRLLLPEQIVNQIKAMKGVERVGEENYEGRAVIKYRYGAATNTQSQAGTVNTESFILVDKETGLPLRSVTSSQSQNGSVQGIQGINLVTEMSNLKTVAAADLFAEPVDYKQVAPEEIKQQVNVLFSAAMAIIGQMMKSAPPANSPN